MAPGSNEEIHDITTAQTALSDDLPRRQKRYFISMMIRTACFILAVVLPSPYRWIALIGSLLLPYFAVIMANAGRESVPRGSAVIDHVQKGIE